MAGDETLGVMGEIEALVSDKLQVVSYKWLSRYFSVSSNDAKRLLQDFTEKHGSRLQVTYTLSGWLKDNPQAYHIRLVPSIRLSEVKQEFMDNCSVQVYSVQASIPKDPAVLWNAEFVQAEELFDQPSSLNNCLRDNRFCGISNSFVKRNIDGNPTVITLPKNGTGTSASLKANGVQTSSSLQQHKNKFPAQSSTVGASGGKNLTAAPEIRAVSAKPPVDKGKDITHSNKIKGRNEKVPSATGGSLSNMWNRASAKPKQSSSTVNSLNGSVKTASTADAHISALEASDVASSDDEKQDTHFKVESNGSNGRKRKAVFYFSDEDDDEENAVSLASPDHPSCQLNPDSQTDRHLVHEKNTATVDIEPKQIELKQEKSKNESGLLVKEHSAGAKAEKPAQPAWSIEAQNHLLGGLADKNNAVSTLPKRKKVLKTRVDERGREVTEVVWEGGVADGSNIVDASKDVSGNRPPVPNKGASSATAATDTTTKPNKGASSATAATDTTAKAGNKKTTKGGQKGAKQGNILSFFKKV